MGVPPVQDGAGGSESEKVLVEFRGEKHFAVFHHKTNRWSLNGFYGDFNFSSIEGYWKLN
ncbi:MAG: hypothetical protein ACRDBG_12815 [Waterburya sp.]